MARSPEARGLDDDCAVFGDLVLTHDMMVAGTHYFADADPADVAWKLVAVNLSDLAAKGAQPVGVLLGYMLGDDAWDRAFTCAFRAALSHYETPLWGGDTVALPRDRRDAPRVMGLTAIGRATHLPVPGRSGARAGDGIWIAGMIGDAYLGYAYLIAQQAGSAQAEPVIAHSNGAIEQLTAALLRPRPMLSEGQRLAPHVTAIMDISDGLLLDATRMARVSACTFAIEFDAVPFSPAFAATAAQSNPSGVPDPYRATRDAAMRFGDDYALLFTLPPGMAAPVAARRIGTVQPAGSAPLLIDGQPADATRPLGYTHAAK